MKIDMQYPDANRYARRLRCAKAVIDTLIIDALEETAGQLKKLDPAGPNDIRLAPDKIVSLSPKSRQQLTQLEHFLSANVYDHPQVAKARDQAACELTFLFNYYLSNPSKLPSRFRERINDPQSIQQVICDYLAGMTDRFCHKLYLQLQ